MMDAAIPDIPAGPPAPVVYGAYGSPGNKICKHLHPPATKPCHLHTLTWLMDIYGIQLARATAAEVSKAGKVYRLVEYAEREEPVAIEVWVVDEAGAKLPNTTVTFCYPAVKGSGTSLTCGANKISVKVKAQGHADFSMTGSGYTKCGQPGPYAAWIDEPNVPSDRVYGLGMLGGTNHRHINLLFQRVKAGKPAKDATRCPLAECTGQAEPVEVPTAGIRPRSWISPSGGLRRGSTATRAEAPRIIDSGLTGAA